MNSQESLKQIKTLIGEHFPHFALVVIDYNDEMWFDYSSQHTARSMFEDGAEQFYEGDDLEEWQKDGD